MKSSNNRKGNKDLQKKDLEPTVGKNGEKA